MSGFAQPIHRRWSVRRAMKRVDKALTSTLEPGESVESAIYAQRYVPMMDGLLLLGALGDIAFILIARPYYLVATQQRFFVLKSGRLFQRAGTVLSVASLNTVRIDNGRRWLVRRTINLRMLSGDEYRLGVHRAYWRELEYMESIVQNQAS